MPTDDDSAETWTPWEVVPNAGFEVSGRRGNIGLRQTTESDFVVDGRFRFSDTEIERDLIAHLVDRGTEQTKAEELVSDARYFESPVSPTNLASVPPFMQWFERPYGRHTLAALIHDDLIEDEPNTGALKSDTLADRFFRQMLGACGVPLVKRWIMWGAVALRSRWVAEGWRRITLLIWLALAVIGGSVFTAGLVLIAVSGDVPSWAWLLFAVAAGLVAISALVRMRSRAAGLAAAGIGAGMAGVGFIQTVAAGAVPEWAWVLLGLGLVLPFVGAPLWGGQWGASLVAAVAGVFVIPAGAFVVLGLGIYWLIEETAAVARPEPPRPQPSP